MIRTPLLWQTIGLSRSSYPFSEYTEPCVPARPEAQSEEGHSSLDIYPCHGWGAKSYNWINGQRQIGFHRFSQVQMMLACFHQAIASSLKKKKKKDRKTWARNQTFWGFRISSVTLEKFCDIPGFSFFNMSTMGVYKLTGFHIQFLGVH